MPAGEYFFYQCVPDGAIDIANVSPGDILNRAWSFRVNGKFEMRANNAQIGRGLDNQRNGPSATGNFDARQIARGYDGQLFTQEKLVDADGIEIMPAGVFLAQVNTWQAQFNPSVTDYNAAGQRQTWGIPMTYTMTLTFTETVISDRLLAFLASFYPSGNAFGANDNALEDAVFNFRGKIRSRFDYVRA